MFRNIVDQARWLQCLVCIGHPIYLSAHGVVVDRNWSAFPDVFLVVGVSRSQLQLSRKTVGRCIASHI